MRFSLGSLFHRNVVLRQVVGVSLVVLLSVAQPAAMAATYHVSVSGDDSNDGSSGSPWRTITHALAVAGSAGNTILVHAGTYNAGEGFPLPVIDGVKVVGDSAATTVVEAPDSVPVFANEFGELSPATELRNMTFRHTTSGQVNPLVALGTPGSLMAPLIDGNIFDGDADGDVGLYVLQSVFFGSGNVTLAPTAPTVTNNVFNDFSGFGNTSYPIPLVPGTGIELVGYEAPSDITPVITGNQFHDNGAGIGAVGLVHVAALSPTISNNTFTGGEIGAILLQNAPLSIFGGVPTATPKGVPSGYTNSVSPVISNNSVTDAETGIGVWGYSPYSPADVGVLIQTTTVDPQLTGNQFDNVTAMSMYYPGALWLGGGGQYHPVFGWKSPGANVVATENQTLDIAGLIDSNTAVDSGAFAALFEGDDSYSSQPMGASLTTSITNNEATSSLGIVTFFGDAGVFPAAKPASTARFIPAAGGWSALQGYTGHARPRTAAAKGAGLTAAPAYLSTGVYSPSIVGNTLTDSGAIAVLSQWSGPSTGTSGITVQNNTVTNGYAGFYSSLQQASNPLLANLVTVQNNQFTGNEHGSIMVSSGQGETPFLYSCNVVDNNTATGVFLAGDNTTDPPADLGGGTLSSPGDNTIAGNPVAVKNDGSQTAKAENNYWGTTNAAAIAGLMVGPVDFDPFLSAPPTNCAAVGGATDVTLTKSVSPASNVKVGDQVTYTLTVQNAGPNGATNVVISDPLPAGVTYVSSSSGCSFSAGTVTCTIPTLAASASASRQIVVTVNSSGPIQNVATVSEDQVDLNPLNNQGSAAIAPQAAAIPTVGEWGLIFLTFLLSLSGLWLMGRRRFGQS